MDITELKQADEALQQALARARWLARFPEENPNPVMRVSADGESLYCNPAAMVSDGWKCEVGRPMPNPILPLVKKESRKTKTSSRRRLGGQDVCYFPYTVFQ